MEIINSVILDCDEDMLARMYKVLLLRDLWDLGIRRFYVAGGAGISDTPNDVDIYPVYERGLRPLEGVYRR